jgi:catechol 2,3-dioxygenase-like lactoylglutathione lyase family enzyme
MKIKRVEHIAIAVDSLRQSIDLLRNTFGLPLAFEEQIGQTRLAMLPVGESYIELLEGQGPESGVTKWIDEKGTITSAGGSRTRSQAAPEHPGSPARRVRGSPASRCAPRPARRARRRSR